MRLREIKLVYSAIPGTNGQHRTRISCPRDAAAVVRDRIADEAVEVFGILLLDTKHQVTGWHGVSRGTLDSALVHPREVFCPAIRDMAAAIVLGHNHPSGDPTPSRDDVALTKRLVDAGELLGIPVLDHVVIGDGGRYCSFKETGRL